MEAHSVKSRFEEIKRFRQEAQSGNKLSRHILAISYMDDYALICMKSMLNSIFVAYYRLVGEALNSLGIELFRNELETFRETPGVKEMGKTEASILSGGARFGVKVQRSLYTQLEKVYTTLANSIDSIVIDKWGKEITASYNLCESFREFKRTPRYDTLVYCLNSMSGKVKRVIDLDARGVGLLQKNSKEGFGVSQIVLDYLFRKPTKVEVKRATPVIPLDPIPETLFISLDANHFEYTADRYIHVFEYSDLVKDILKETIFVLADYFDVDDLPLNVITDFKKEDAVIYNKIEKLIREIIDSLLALGDIKEEIIIDFPKEYIKWLSYHDNIEYRKIGEALAEGSLKVRLNLKELFNEYLRSKVRRLISNVLDRNPNIVRFTILDRKIKDSAFIKAIRSLRQGLEYCQWEGAEYNYILANASLTGVGGTKNIPSALRRLKKSADDGNAKAQYLLGMFLRYGKHIECDNQEAIKLLTAASEQDYSLAFYFLAQMYMAGEGLERPNEKKATELLKKAVSLNHEKSKIVLAHCYLTGRGVQQSCSSYAALVSGFVDSNNGEGLALLADAYYEGIGIPIDKEKGRQLYMRAAEAGDLKSQKILGKIYMEGIDVDMNLELASKWYMTAADAGDPEAQYLMAKIGMQKNNLHLCANYLAKSIVNRYESALSDNTMAGLFPKEFIDRWK